MDTKKLRQKVLDLAIRGKLVPQDPNDEPASVLLERIKEEKDHLIKEGKIKRDKKEKTSDTSHYEKVPFEVPESWGWCRLEDLCDYGTCKSISPKEIPDNAWILDLEDIEKDTAKLLQRTRKIDRNTTSTRHSFSKGNVLYSKLRTYLNKVLVADTDGFSTTEILPLDFKSFVAPEYARYVLMSKMFLDYTAQCGYGVKMPRLGTNDGKKAPFPLPPLSEQKRIISKIEESFTLIDQIEESKLSLSQFIKQTKSKVLDLAIRGKLVPQDINDEPIKIEILKTKSSDISHYPFDVPNGWTWVKIKDIVTYIQRGKSPKYSPIKKYPVLAQKCNQWSGITLENVLFFEPETFEKYTKERFLQTGDIIINSTGTGTLGRIGLFDTNILREYECIVADSHITVVRCNQQLIIPEYVYRFLCSEYQQKIIEDNAAGSTNQKELYIDTIKEFYIPCPPLIEQKRIIQKIETLFQTLDSIQNNL